jgi:tetratricopeptide (TPR) repeat protein
MVGHFDEARAILADVRDELADRGGRIALASVLGHDSVYVELLAGAPEAAVELGQEACRLLDELGQKAYLSTAAGNLARALYALGRVDEADSWALRAAELGASDDAMTQMLSRRVRAKVLARRGKHVVAERLAREAVALAERTDFLNALGDTYTDFAEVLELAGRSQEAADTYARALACYDRKGHTVMAERTRERLVALLEQTPTS